MKRITLQFSRLAFSCPADLHEPAAKSGTKAHKMHQVTRRQTIQNQKFTAIAQAKHPTPWYFAKLVRFLPTKAAFSVHEIAL